MKAVVKYAKGKGMIEMREIAQTQDRAEDVLIEVKASAGMRK